MGIGVLNVRVSSGSYRVTTTSGAIYTLDLFDVETDMVGASGSKDLERLVYALTGGIITVGKQMTLEPLPTFEAMMGHRGVITSPVASIELI